LVHGAPDRPCGRRTSIRGLAGDEIDMKPSKVVERTAYEQLSKATDGHDVEIRIRTSTLAALLDDPFFATFNEAAKPFRDSILKNALKQIAEDPEVHRRKVLHEKANN